MTTPQCATGCGSPSPNAIICGGCADGLRAALTMAASIEPDLLDAVARQLRHGHGKNSGSEPPLPYDPAASDARQALAVALADAAWHPPGVTWDDADTSISGMARWLLAHITELAASPRAGRDYHAIRSAVDRCARVLDGPPSTVYAGPCPACGTDLLGAPGTPVITCRCGHAAEVALQQDAMRAVLEDRLFTAAELVSMAKALGKPVSEHTARSWIHRGQLVAKGTRPRHGGEPSATYRFGDMLDLAARRQRVKG